MFSLVRSAESSKRSGITLPTRIASGSGNVASAMRTGQGRQIIERAGAVEISQAKAHHDVRRIVHSAGGPSANAPCSIGIECRPSGRGEIGV
jgi:hypothetical protein